MKLIGKVLGLMILIFVTIMLVAPANADPPISLSFETAGARLDLEGDSPGDLDLSFGSYSGRVVLLSESPWRMYASDVALLSDGKIVALLDSTDRIFNNYLSSGNEYDEYEYRYGSDGEVERVTGTFYNEYATPAYLVRLDADGRVLEKFSETIGSSHLGIYMENILITPGDNILVVYNVTDRNDNDGRENYNIGLALYSRDLKLISDLKPFGYHPPSVDEGELYVYDLMPERSRGSVTFRLGKWFDKVGASEIQPDGKILLAGWSRMSMTSSDDYPYDHFTDTCEDLNTEPPNPVDMEGFQACNERGREIIEEIRSIMRSRYSHEPRFKMWLMRLNSDGTPDPSFGQNGRVLVYEGDPEEPISPASSDFIGYGWNIGLQSDGKILVKAGYRIKRYKTDGRIDKTIVEKGLSGWFLEDGGEISVSAECMLVTPDDKIILFGRVSGVTGTVLQQLNADGRLDYSFGTAGFTVFDMGIRESIQYQYSLGSSALDPITRQIVMCLKPAVIARFNRQGLPDIAFGPFGEGWLNYNVYAAVEEFGIIFDCVVQPDRKILVAGKLSELGVYHPMLLRFRGRVNLGSRDKNQRQPEPSDMIIRTQNFGRSSIPWLEKRRRPTTKEMMQSSPEGIMRKSDDEGKGPHNK